MEADALSIVLMKMRLNAAGATALGMGNRWGFKVPKSPGIKLFLLLKGSCWVSVEGTAKPVRLQAGDCCLLPLGKPFSLASHPSPKRLPIAYDILEGMKRGSAEFRSEDENRLLSVAFHFKGHWPQVIFGRLPAIIPISGTSEHSAALRWNLNRFASEFNSAQIGRMFMLNQLAPALFLQILRIHMSGDTRDNSWFSALMHPKLSKAIRAIHFDYGKALSLENLAKISGMSRSTFASSFKEQVGLSPADYLSRWRMQIACELLEQREQSLSEIANLVGYESESAFSAAFKRIMKQRPGSYQRAFNAPFPAGGE